MKICLHLVPLLLTAGILQAQTRPEAPPQTNSATALKIDASVAIGGLRKPYDTAMIAIAAENQRWLAGAEKWYLANLEKVQTDYVKAGDLDGAVAVKAERERVVARGETTAEQIQAMPAALRTLRGTYDASQKKIADDIGRRKAQEGQKYHADLAALEKRITMSGDLDQALLVKAEKERIGAEIPADVPAQVSAPATPAPPVITPEPLTSRKSEGKVDDPAAMLIGTWHFTYLKNHWKGTRTFHKDGTMTDSGFKGVGTWTVGDKQIIIRYPDGNEEHMVLPLHPGGTKVLSVDDAPKVTAVKGKDS